MIQRHHIPFIGAVTKRVAITAVPKSENIAMAEIDLIILGC
jgi:hypothetical protein